MRGTRLPTRSSAPKGFGSRRRSLAAAVVASVLGIGWGACATPPGEERLQPVVSGEAPATAIALDGGPVDSPPWAYYEEKPCYPQSAQTARIAGTVLVSVVVDELGRPEQVALVRGSPVLRKCAEEAAWHWRFAPARRDSLPVRVKVVIPFDFRLR